MLPVLVALTLVLVWLVALAVTKIQVVDGAREVARAMARDESQASAVALGRRVAPEGARFLVHRRAGLVEVEVVAEVRGPGGLLDFLPGLDVAGHAVSAEEVA